MALRKLIGRPEGRKKAGKRAAKGAGVQHFPSRRSDCLCPADNGPAGFAPLPQGVSMPTSSVRGSGSAPISAQVSAAGMRT